MVNSQQNPQDEFLMKFNNPGYLNTTDFFITKGGRISKAQLAKANEKPEADIK